MADYCQIEIERRRQRESGLVIANSVTFQVAVSCG